MSRDKRKPAVQKPAFDEESVLRFVRGSGGSDGPAVEPTPHPPGETADGRLPLTLMLKPEVIARLQGEAARKEKSVGQVVEKLVVKQWGKQ